MKFLLPLLLAIPAAADDSGAKTIYGSDSRLDFYEVADPVQRSVLPAAVSLFNERKLRRDGDSYSIRGTSFGGPSRAMCPGERFFEQKTAAFCSGTLIGPDLVLTAGHCMGKKDKPADRCGTTRFVFGFALAEPGRQPESVPASDVYSCASVVLYSYSASGDFAVVKLDRPVSGRNPAQVSVSAPPEAGAGIFTVGGPYGLPLKATGDAEIRALLQPAGFFSTSLDTSGGNSGGGVFDARSGRLVGVHTATADPDLREIPLPHGHGLPVTDPRVISGKCKTQASFGAEEGRGKRGFALYSISGLSAVMMGARPDLIPRDMAPVETSPEERLAPDAFGELP